MLLRPLKNPREAAAVQANVNELFEQQDFLSAETSFEALDHVLLPHPVIM